MRSLTVRSARLFQSTLPVGGATPSAIPLTSFAGISIHAPRGGSDPMRSLTVRSARLFQSTLPVGGATSIGFAYY